MVNQVKLSQIVERFDLKNLIIQKQEFPFRM